MSNYSNCYQIKQNTDLEKYLGNDQNYPNTGWRIFHYSGLGKLWPRRKLVWIKIITPSEIWPKSHDHPVFLCALTRLCLLIIPPKKQKRVRQVESTLSILFNKKSEIENILGIDIITRNIEWKWPRRKNIKIHKVSSFSFLLDFKQFSHPRTPFWERILFW